MTAELLVFTRPPLSTRQAVEEEVVRMGQAACVLRQADPALFRGASVYDVGLGRDIPVEEALQKVERCLLEVRRRVNQHKAAGPERE